MGGVVAAGVDSGELEVGLGFAGGSGPASAQALTAARRRAAVEADREKPRSTARWVTLISAGVLVILAVSGTYVEPYRSPFGQVILVVLLSAYVATLVWMRQMAIGRPLPRFLDHQPGAAR